MNHQKVFFPTNIKFLRERKKMSQETMANLLGFTRSKLAAIESGATKLPPAGDLIKISEYFSISIDSLLKVDLAKLGGLKLRELEAGNEVYITGTNMRVLSITVDKENNENTEYVPVKAKAGYASGGYNDPDFIAGLPKFTLPGLPKNGSYRIFPITGDSMLPVPDGSRIVAKFVTNWKEIKAGTPCIVILNGNQDFVFKMVTFDGEGNVVLRSLNKLYEPYIVELGDIREIWQYYEHHTNGLPEPQTDMQHLLKTVEEIKQHVSILSGSGRQDNQSFSH
jgi:transcriptional regulator with XRE-family HTH domain